MNTIFEHTSYKIEIATWRDLGQIREQEKICFPVDSWPLLDLIGALSLPNYVRYKASLGDKIVGFGLGELKPNEKTGWIASISILPEHRGKGLATKMLSIIENEMNLPTVKLSVRASNDAAISLYLKEGYLRVGRWRKYYKGKEDAVVMRKDLLG